MEKVKIALIGAGGISQIVRIPSLKKMEDVELVAICDIDKAKVGFIADKYQIPRVYFDSQNMLNSEEIDGVIISTPNNLHCPIALSAMDKNVHTLIEKPMALNAEQAERMVNKAEQKNVHLVCGMQNRFREDAVILKEFIQNNEIGDTFYVKSGWLKRWERHLNKGWMGDSRISGGGVVIDMGIQLIDLALWLIGNPEVSEITSYFYNMFVKGDVEDSALVVLRTQNNIAITIEIAWRMHIDKDLTYTHVFGSGGGAFLNPLRLNKELHGNLVNVTPIQEDKNVDLFKKAFENEIRNFVNVIKGEAKPVTPGTDGLKLMRIIDKIYKVAKKA